MATADHRRAVSIPLIGGFGNQMFQYAAGLYIRETTGRPVEFDLSYLSGGLRRKHVTPRALEIADLVGDAVVGPHPTLRVAFDTLRDRLELFGSLRERSLNDDVMRRLTNRKNRVHGYHQNAQLVQRIRPQLLARLRDIPRFHPFFFDQTQDRIAVHMRYGDYASNPVSRAFHGLTHATYFVDAVEKLSLVTKFEQVLIVSDEPSKALHDFQHDYTGRLPVAVSDSTGFFDDFVAIGTSKGIVASNSSFSWWSAWLGSELHQSTVIVPEPWYAGVSVPIRHIVPPTWTPIKREYMR